MRRLTLRKDSLTQLGDATLGAIAGATSPTCACTRDCPTVDADCPSLQAECFTAHAGCPTLPVADCTTPVIGIDKTLLCR